MKFAAHDIITARNEFVFAPQPGHTASARQGRSPRTASCAEPAPDHAAFSAAPSPTPPIAEIRATCVNSFMLPSAL
jgi:hypothetical protein